MAKEHNYESDNPIDLSNTIFFLIRFLCVSSIQLGEVSISEEMISSVETTSSNFICTQSRRMRRNCVTSFEPLVLEIKICKHLPTKLPRLKIISSLELKLRKLTRISQDKHRKMAT